MERVLLATFLIIGFVVFRVQGNYEELQTPPEPSSPCSTPNPKNEPPQVPPPPPPPPNQPPCNDKPPEAPPKNEPPAQPPKNEPPCNDKPPEAPPKNEPPAQPPKNEPPCNDKPPEAPPKNEPPAQPPKNEPPCNDKPPEAPPKNEPPAQPPKNEPPAQPPKNEPPAQPPKNEPPCNNEPPEVPPKKEPPAEPPKNEPPCNNEPPQIPPKNEPPAKPPKNEPPCTNGQPVPPKNEPPQEPCKNEPSQPLPPGQKKPPGPPPSISAGQESNANVDLSILEDADNVTINGPVCIIVNVDNDAGNDMGVNAPSGGGNNTPLTPGAPPHTNIPPSPNIISSKPLNQKAILSGTICRWNSDTMQQPESFKVTPDIIDGSICDAISIESAILDKDTLLVQPKNGDADIDSYRKIGSLVNHSLLVLGNYNDSGDGDKYSRLLQCEKSIQAFIDDLIMKLCDWGLKGIEISYIWPGAPQFKNTQNSQEKEQFLAFVQKLYTAFKEKDLFVVIDVPYQQQYLELGFDLAIMKDFVDVFVILTYDMTGFWDGHTGQGVYLNPSDCDGGTQAIDLSVKNIISQGVSGNKIVITLPLYARTFTVKDENQKCCIGAPTIGGGPPGPQLHTEGILNFIEACQAQDSDWTKPNVVVSYVDVIDIEAVAYYVRERELAGICLHSIDSDDFHNVCCTCKTTFPLTRTAFEVLHDQQRSEKNDCLDPVKLNRLPLNAPCC